MSESVLLMFSSKSFIASSLTFRAIIHFEFIFVYGVRKCSSFILLQVVDQFSQQHLLKRLSFLHCIFLPPLFVFTYIFFIIFVTFFFFFPISFQDHYVLKFLTLDILSHLSCSLPACLVTSVMSDSLQHGPWPARLLCPRDSPGENTGVGSHFFLQS